ncbi:MAG TPA: acetolactate synthase small subunit [Vicinamibacterales bacterium]|nr:acetolactate synthase small subunit [Vicinamibacterales bacterium]
MNLHTFAIYVDDAPGVLNRVASLFRRRGFNIHSLAVGHSEVPGVSRMTAVVQTDDSGAQRVEAHLYRLVNVLRVENITRRPSIARDLALVKVSADGGSRPALVQLAQVFNARVVDVAPGSLVLEMCGSEARIDALLDVLQPYGVLEMVRAGRIAMARGTGADAAAREVTESPAIEEGIAYSV